MAAASHSQVTEQDLNAFRFSVDQILTLVEKLEKQVNDVEQFYESIDLQINKDKEDQKKHLFGTKNPLQGASQSKVDSAEGMQELMLQFSTILHQITQHKWAWPFMKPVDVEGLGLYDYYQVIDKPMDFSTIKSKMDAKDGSVYKNVREIYSDVRLIFKNAMKYNEEKNDIHVMAKTLLEKFEEKWLLLLPKVDELERRNLEEEAHVQLEKQLDQEATYATMATDLTVTLDEVDMHLRSLKALVMQRCRELSAHEKVLLGTALTRLSPEYLNRALQIVSENNPSFQYSSGEVVNLDINAQSDFTLWRLNVFVKYALDDKGGSASAKRKGINHWNNIDDNNNSKRRRIL